MSLEDRLAFQDRFILNENFEWVEKDEEEAS